jgi:NAD(P)-dependent dehydrogenase (short-subunit alcohol dehydrogenase family)
MRLQGKVALITGAGGGIGREIALVFAREGADIAVNDVDIKSAENTVEEIRQIGRSTIAIKADVGSPDEVDKMVDRTIYELHGIHILVNNAAIFDEAVPTIKSSVEHWDKVIRVVLRGTYLCCRRAGQWMINHKMGKIINIGSIAGVAGYAPRPSYGPAKAAVIHLTRSLAIEWAEHNINVNCITPGHVLTPRILEYFKTTQTDMKLIEQRIPLGRFAKPEEIASVALFLASDESNYITGVNLPVDGGWLAYGLYVKGREGS